tara:strand:+ start:581 stop:712 length:132 start_codon:yes stop_codon:yes gene_type:complete
MLPENMEVLFENVIGAQAILDAIEPYTEKEPERPTVDVSSKSG